MSFFRESFTISVDIDGVLVYNFPYWKALFELYAKEHNHNPEIIPGKESPYWDYFYSICQKCWKNCLSQSDLIKAYELRPEAKEILAWFQLLGLKIVLVTSRPNEVAEATKEWSKEVLGNIIEDVIITNNKVEACSLIGVKYHIEDAPHHLTAFNQQSIVTPIIWNAPYNEHIEGSRVHSWAEVATHILWKEHKS